MSNSTAPSQLAATLSLSGKSALVTGSSSGIGRAMAVALAQAGADVHLHTRRNAKGLADVRRLISHAGGGGGNFTVDLSDDDGPDTLVESAWNLGPVDVWINNAGVDVLTGDAAKWSYERKLHALWQVDVRGTMLLSRSIGRRMKQRGSGTIINIGWDQAHTGMSGDSGEMFAAAKGAIMSATLSLAKSMAPEVRVNCIAPGWIRTKWSERASDYWDRRAQGESLVGRWGEPEDVVAAAVFLASPAASFINAVVLPVNGGFAGSYVAAEGAH